MCVWYGVDHDIKILDLQFGMNFPNESCDQKYTIL